MLDWKIWKAVARKQKCNFRSFSSIFYRQELETSFIGYLAERLGTGFREAMKLYYDSKLSALIESGSNGIDNLDYKNLAEDLLENE